MSYLQDVDIWLHELLQSLPPTVLEPVKKAIKARILESYRNGVEDGKRAGNKPLRTRFPRVA